MDSLLSDFRSLLQSKAIFCERGEMPILGTARDVLFLQQTFSISHSSIRASAYFKRSPTTGSRKLILFRPVSTDNSITVVGAVILPDGSGYMVSAPFIAADCPTQDVPACTHSVCPYLEQAIRVALDVICNHSEQDSFKVLSGNPTNNTDGGQS